MADREQIAADVEAAVGPLLDEDRHDDPPGYNCCGCDSYREILDHCLAVIRGVPYEHPDIRWRREAKASGEID